jgi:hypothetical protein
MMMNVDTRLTMPWPSPTPPTLGGHASQSANEAPSGRVTM